ncbi:hypothetical protein CUMW_215600 [Citrus unshiu]|uniref:non-specific serine/threonine protein kinase n=1 Tax=Citrus unshiu TaxID=55188 RepID=A0A2H5QBZ3_CITUN|nr:hypothetical protein CUMW_215600 [Citrus unshiu]
MPTQQLTTESVSEKAWHILALLLSQRRPVRLAEIAPRCTLFHATPDLIQSLCLIPNSPISLSDDLYVTLSPIALLTFAKIVANNFCVFDALTPRLELGPRSEDPWRLGFMKRKRSPFDDSDTYEEGWVGMKMFAEMMVPKTLMQCEFDSELALSTRLPDLNSCLRVDPMYCLDDMKQNNASAAKTVVVNYANKGTNAESSEYDTIVESKEKEQFTDLGTTKRIENIVLPLDTTLIDKPSLDNEHEIDVDIRAVSPAAELPVTNRQLRKPSAKTKFLHKDGIDPQGPKLQASRHNKAFDAKEKKQGKRDQISRIVALKATGNHYDVKDQRKNSNSFSPKDQTNAKVLPNFESFIVEEEEGSGGYGTVYRARRKNDGTVVAIKCPHANASKHYVSNELRMLERFGGKNFIIKYEGCFKCGDSDCFVLEHVKHDRPEVLKKEIDLSQLQWYGYCLFRALASLHKQGIVHRDVKPGNFLFSCKAVKGNGKQKKDGPCAGTKGFRAPEVLFRSQHQGPKLDIWSAGVTLLYLMIGRTPFFGDPEQNIKDIAKLRGSEDLWEVAKLHNRESSFPEDLYAAKSSPPINLPEWCKLITKRPDFLEVIPSSLFDLVDKCLTVNPRLRISAEDALKHEFFAPCHEMLRKQKLLRQGSSIDNTTGNPSHKQCSARPLKISQ